MQPWLQLQKADYTADSWTAYQVVVAANVMTFANTQAEVDAAIFAIETAQHNLVFAGQADLAAAKAAEALLTSTDYVDYSAVTAALALLETTNAEVVAKTTAINTAVAALVTKEAAATLAEAAVATAEGSNLQADVDAAQALVTALPDGAEKTALQGRIDAVQAIIDAAAALAEAQTAALAITNETQLGEALTYEGITELKLTGSFSLTSTVNIDRAVTRTLDLNGNTISSALGTAFYLTKGTLNVVDNAVDKGGISVSGEAFRVNGTANASASDAVLDIGAGVNVTSSADCAVYIYGKATLNTAGNLTSNDKFAAIQGNGNVSSNETVINITGGKVIATLAGYHAIYVPQNVQMNISGGEISSAGTAIEAKGGTLTISGGTISTSASSTSHVPNSNGGSAVGYALAVIDNAGYSGALVTISGGTFNGPVALLDDDANVENNTSSLSITGGTFSNLVNVVKHTSEASNINIKLLNNVALTELIRVSSGQSITLDLNGKTISSALGTAFYLTKGTLNVVDNAVDKGEISVSGEAFRVNGTANASASDAVLDIGAGVNVTSSADCAVYIYGKATLNTAGNLTSNDKFAAIQGNGNVSSNETVINITGGKVIATLAGYHAIYVPQDGQMNISGGEISSAGTAIEAKGGTLTISGGTISTSASSTSHVPNSNGGSAVGYALAVIDNAGYSGALVTISGGTFNGPVALLDDDSDAENNRASLIINAISAKPTSIQSILDQAGDGTTINLTAGEYGTIYLRQSESKSQSIDVSDWAGDGDVERYREFKDISIVGTTGAEVDQIAVEAQLYPSTGTGHSNANGENLSSYISISNLTLKNIEFTGNKPVAVNLQSIWGHSGVNGLTIDGCTLTGKAVDKEAQTSFLLRADGHTPTEIKDKTTNELIMITGRSDLTVKNCTVDNVWMPINITEWNDITISNNHFSNSGRNDIQVSGPSTGTVSITGNTLDGAGERTIRLNDLTGGVTITGNTITNCVGRTTDTMTSLMHFSAAGDDTTVYLSGNSWNGDTDEQATVDKLIIDSPAVVTVEND